MSAPVLITGAASGLGLELARELARRAQPLIIASRDGERGRTAAEQLRRRHPGLAIDVVELDLASLASVARAVSVVRRRYPEGLAGIVCNAAVQVVSGVRTSADGYELTFATNHLGHFTLVLELVDLVVDGGTVVSVSSGTHAGPEASFGFPAPAWKPPRSLADPDGMDPSPNAGRSRYATSKLANLYFTRELARREPRLRANAFDPGLMPATGLARDYPRPLRTFYRLLSPVLSTFVPGASTPARSARRLADLVIARRFAGFTGTYVVGRRVTESSPESRDPVRAAELWDASLELAQVHK